MRKVVTSIAIAAMAVIAVGVALMIREDRRCERAGIELGWRR